MSRSRVVLVSGIGAILAAVAGYQLNDLLERKPDQALEELQQVIFASKYVLTDLLRDPYCESDLWRKLVVTNYQRIKSAEEVAQYRARKIGVTVESYWPLEPLRKQIVQSVIDEIETRFAEPNEIECLLLTEQSEIFTADELKEIELMVSRKTAD